MERKTCPTCGNGIAADHPLGLCPACLMKEGLETQSAVPLLCTACQSPLLDDARFCAYCGAPAPVSAAPAEGDPLRAALEAKLLGQYRIVRMLGRGGMGAVYLARDLTLEREVAIKVVGTVSDREVYERFRREARTAAKLSHANIVPLHAFGEVEGMPYFVMGYVRGESLADRLRREGNVAEEQARRILADVANALDHAHRHGVIHRDIKPDNVLLEDQSGRALLTDFGVAKATGASETLTRFGGVVGTPHYMSPEQADGHAGVDCRSDLYSLGVMAYAMLAGRLPFEGTSHADVLTKHLTQEPPPLRSLAPSVSDAMVQAVERCLAKDPASRWPDARSLALALGTSEDNRLPDDLAAVEGHGMTTLLICAGWLFGLVVFNAPDFAIGMNVVAMVGIYLAVAIRLRIAGFPIRESQRVIWTEPSWWPLWYPRALRRRGNVWDRLPASVRQVRWWFPALMVYGIYLFTGRFPNLFRNPEVFMIKVGVGFTGLMLLGMFLDFRARRELRRKGLSWGDAHRVATTMAPSRVSFWSRPHIAAILAPAIAAEPRAASPHDQLQSILRHANELSGPLRPLGAQAAVAARQLLESIEQVDRQLADLSRNLEPGEEERLAAKIDALAASDDAAPLRSLLEKQLELIRGLSARIEEAEATRNRRVEMLKTLALHLASLRARLSEPDVRPLSDNVRALCDEISRQAVTVVADAPTMARG